MVFQNPILTSDPAMLLPTKETNDSLFGLIFAVSNGQIAVQFDSGDSSFSVEVYTKAANDWERETRLDFPGWNRAGGSKVVLRDDILLFGGGNWTTDESTLLSSSLWTYTASGSLVSPGLPQGNLSSQALISDDGSRAFVLSQPAILIAYAIAKVPDLSFEEIGSVTGPVCESFISTGGNYVALSSKCEEYETQKFINLYFGDTLDFALRADLSDGDCLPPVIDSSGRVSIMTKSGVIKRDFEPFLNLTEVTGQSLPQSCPSGFSVSDAGDKYAVGWYNFGVAYAEQIQLK
jgi:hypothetical protein